MNIPEGLAPVVVRLKQASACLRAAALVAGQDAEMRGVAGRLRKMDQEAAQYAEYIISYFTPAV